MRQPLIVATQRVFAETRKMLTSHGRLWSPEEEQGVDRGLWIDLAREAEALMVFMPDRIDERFLSQCGRLKIVACALKGFDNIDVEACTRRGIWVTIVPDLLSAPTADLAIGLLLALTRKILEGDRFVRTGGFQGWRPRFYGAGLEGKTAGIVGFGGVGRRIAHRLKAFGMNPVCFDPITLDPGMLADLGVEQVPFDALLQVSEVIVVAAPLSPASRHLFDRQAFARMRPGAFLVNVGRGSVVDEEAVSEALQNGQLGGYAADVFAMEDLSLSDRPASIPSALLLASSRTVFTPHLGSAVVEVRRAIEAAAAVNIIDVLQGRSPRDAVNRL